MTADTLPIDDCVKPAIVAKAPVRRAIVAPKVKRKRLYRTDPPVEEECEKPAMPSLILPLVEAIEPAGFSPVPPATFEQLASDEPEEGSGPGTLISTPTFTHQFAPVTPVPEPSTYLLFLAGLGAIAYRSRRES